MLVSLTRLGARRGEDIPGGVEVRMFPTALTLGHFDRLSSTSLTNSSLQHVRSVSTCVQVKTAWSDILGNSHHSIQPNSRGLNKLLKLLLMVLLPFVKYITKLSMNPLAAQRYDSSPIRTLTIHKKVVERC
jgi:hypothetical protein